MAQNAVQRPQTRLCTVLRCALERALSTLTPCAAQVRIQRSPAPTGGQTPASAPTDDDCKIPLSEMSVDRPGDVPPLPLSVIGIIRSRCAAAFLFCPATCIPLVPSRNVFSRQGTERQSRRFVRDGGDSRRASQKGDGAVADRGRA